jgi:hypothetical protein
VWDDLTQYFYQRDSQRAVVPPFVAPAGPTRPPPRRRAPPPNKKQA